MRQPPQFESAESASPVITRLIAGVLRGEHERVFNFAPWERLGMQLLNRLPVGIAQAVVRAQFSLSALSPEIAKGLTAEAIAEQRLRDYQALDERYPVVVIGAALGGAAAHIAAVLRGPFLPQPFILGLRLGSEDESLARHLAVTTPVAEAILKGDYRVSAISHFDPIHDGWLTRTVSHLRLKLIDLPRAYQAFIQDHLEPGGTILYLECTAQWPQLPLSERFSCQIGGWGGISPQEYLEGSERIDQFLIAAGSSHRGGWGVSGITPEMAPESEWGSAPGLGEASRNYAEQRGYRFQRVTLDHPHDFSRLALAAHRLLYEQLGLTPRGLLIETFTQYDPYLVLQAALLPLWLVFNTSDSLRFLRHALRDIPEALPTYFSGLTTLSRTPDMVPWEGWVDALEGRDWVSIGAGPRRYPEDLVALFRWDQRLRERLPHPPQTPLPHLDIEDFITLIEH